MKNKYRWKITLCSLKNTLHKYCVNSCDNLIFRTYQFLNAQNLSKHISNDFYQYGCLCVLRHLLPSHWFHSKTTMNTETFVIIHVVAIHSAVLGLPALFSHCHDSKKMKLIKVSNFQLFTLDRKLMLV